MAGQNISDIIEAYLKEILAADRQIEINRASIAAQFNCVPSQINYVIKTRFSSQQGYLVESKRGGGGYIRIEKLRYRDQDHYLNQLLALVTAQISFEKAVSILQQLVDNKVLSTHEAQLLATMLTDDAFAVTDQVATDTLRANLLSALLNGLRYQRF